MDEIPSAEYERIAREISSDESVVGIDAKKTHILILHALRDIQTRLDRIERDLDSGPPQR